MPSGLTPLLISIGGVAALAAGSSLYSAWVRRRFQGLERAWRAYAAIHDMRLVPASALRPEAGPHLEGEASGVAVIIALHDDSGRTMTRVEAPLAGVSETFMFAIYRRSALGGQRPERADLVETTLGNKPFDADFAIYSNEPDAARSILDRRLALVIRTFPKAFDYLFAENNRLSLIWSGMEDDAATLDAAVELVRTACRRRA